MHGSILCMCVFVYVGPIAQMKGYIENEITDDSSNLIIYVMRKDLCSCIQEKHEKEQGVMDVQIIQTNLNLTWAHHEFAM